jgi:hypothetical protein
MKPREVSHTREFFLALAQETFEPPLAELTHGAIRAHFLDDGASDCEINCKRLHIKRNRLSETRAWRHGSLPQRSRARSFTAPAFALPAGQSTKVLTRLKISAIALQ